MRLDKVIDNRYSVLLVDDEPEILSVLSRVLEDDGFEVMTACSGEGAIEVLSAETFDLIMTDVRMPGISGFELIEHIATVDSAVKIIVMTGYDSTDMVKQALRTGAYDYLTKPLDDHDAIIRCANRVAQATRLVRDNADLLDQLRTNQTKLEKANQRLLEMNEELHIQANTDVLTDLYNRRYLEKTLRNEVSRRNRYSDPLSVAMVDVDHFKQINDKYGHKGGDVVLKAISENLSNCVRASDIVGRYGGEEFLVLLPRTTPAEAMMFAERIRSAIFDQVIDIGDSTCRAAISVGVSGVDSRFPELDLLDLLNSADQALYAAKGAGRNCIRVHSVTSGAQNMLKASSGV